ncbi:MAG: hypothetical protein KGD67_11660, partial [Candidatus Lokiarchaeota archaeon]|nr:hypothetical protein [Candidatus Lokiarchaeota archaeon]
IILTCHIIKTSINKSAFFLQINRHYCMKFVIREIERSRILHGFVSYVMKLIKEKKKLKIMNIRMVKMDLK